jgi:asparagine synthase (glutamine-hydrolysing)
MCGISGIYSELMVEENLLQRIADSMKHRGPDHQAFKRFGDYSFVHARLSILDLNPRSNQPMTDSDQKFAICFNGEVYNFKDLRLELEHLGHTFLTNSDTEVILIGFKAWREKLFPKLNGIFSIALLDIEREELYLVRDPSGTKPLFYSFKDGRFSFSSELKAQIMLPWISRDIDRSSLFYFLKFSHVPNPESILRDVKQLNPSTYLVFRKKEFTLHSYIPERISTYSPKSFDGALESLDLLFEKVIRRQLVSDVPVGCFLSGGIDSSLICYYHAKVSSSKIKTFTIGYQEKEFDESIHAKEISRLLGTEHFELILKPKDLLAEIDNLPRYFDHPFADPTMLSSLLLARHASKEVKVVFSGDGGDELFFGYQYQKMILQALPYLKIPSFFRQALSATIESLLSPLSRNSLLFQRVRKFCEIFAAKDQAEFMQYFIGTIGPVKVSRINSLLKAPVQTTTLPLITSIAETMKDDELKISELFLKTFLVNCALQKNDRSSMAFGLEARVPFLDNEMVEFAKTLPFDYIYRSNSSKHILRTLFYNKVPSALAHRKKQGFSIPLREWLRSELREVVEDYLGESLKTDPNLNFNETRKVIEEHMDNRANHSHLIWSLLMYRMWSKEYKL